MTPPSGSDTARQPTYSWRFATMSFLSLAGVGVYGVYLSLYLQRRGVSNAELGVLLAIGACVGSSAPMAWGVVADVLNRWRLPVATVHVVDAVLFPLFWFWPGTPFWVACVLMASFMFCARSSLPLIEAWTLSHVAKTGADYGILRAWGSLGYMMPLAASYFFLQARSGGEPRDLLPVFVGFCALRILAAGWTFTMPDDRSASARPRLDLWALRAAYARPSAVVFFFAVFATRFVFEPFYAFFTLYLDELGIPDNTKGLFWVVGVASEICLMAVSSHIIRRFGTVRLLLSGVAAMAVRYYVLSVTPPWPVVLVSQLSHALTFGAFHVASMLIISRITPEAFRASGLTFSAGLLGAGGMFGSLLGGMLADRYGIPGFFRVFSAIAAGTLVILVFGFKICEKHDGDAQRGRILETPLGERAL